MSERGVFQPPVVDWEKLLLLVWDDNQRKQQTKRLYPDRRPPPPPPPLVPPVVVHRLDTDASASAAAAAMTPSRSRPDNAGAAAAAAGAVDVVRKVEKKGDDQVSFLSWQHWQVEVVRRGTLVRTHSVWHSLERPGRNTHLLIGSALEPQVDICYPNLYVSRVHVAIFLAPPQLVVVEDKNSREPQQMVVEEEEHHQEEEEDQQSSFLMNVVHLYVMDLHSTYGTYLNYTKMEPYIPVKLTEGDIIHCGPTNKVNTFFVISNKQNIQHVIMEEHHHNNDKEKDDDDKHHQVTFDKPRITNLGKRKGGVPFKTQRTHHPPSTFQEVVPISNEKTNSCIITQFSAESKSNPTIDPTTMTMTGGNKRKVVVLENDLSCEFEDLPTDQRLLVVKNNKKIRQTDHQEERPPEDDQDDDDQDEEKIILMDPSLYDTILTDEDDDYFDRTIKVTSQILHTSTTTTDNNIETKETLENKIKILLTEKAKYQTELNSIHRKDSFSQKNGQQPSSKVENPLVQNRRMTVQDIFITTSTTTGNETTPTGTCSTREEVVEDDEIDPLDAFMQQNTLLLEIDRAAKLVENLEQISKEIEKLKNYLEIINR